MTGEVASTGWDRHWPWIELTDPVRERIRAFIEEGEGGDRILTQGIKEVLREEVPEIVGIQDSPQAGWQVYPAPQHRVVRKHN